MKAGNNKMFLKNSTPFVTPKNAAAPQTEGQQPSAKFRADGARQGQDSHVVKNV
jgi:hypothetical protein